MPDGLGRDGRLTRSLDVEELCLATDFVPLAEVDSGLSAKVLLDRDVTGRCRQACSVLKRQKRPRIVFLNDPELYKLGLPWMPVTHQESPAPVVPGLF